MNLKLFKSVNIEVLSTDNKKVIRRFRFNPPDDPKTGRKTRFTEKGVDQVLENLIASFDRDNPDHKYRLVTLKDKFRLVWTPDPEEDPLKKEQEAMLAVAQAAAGNSPCKFDMPLPEPLTI
jgi:hypothetical protein